MNYYQKLRRELIESYGGECEKCGSRSKLEFCHKHPTDIQGRGRGGFQRYYDVLQNRRGYRLLCRKCHLEYEAWKRARSL